MRKLCIVVLAVLLCFGSAYAWYATNFLGEVEIPELSVSVPDGETMTITTIGTNSVTELYPLSSANGYEFVNQAFEQVENDGYWSTTIQIKTDEQTSHLVVNDLQITGGGELAKAVRVSVTYFGECKIYGIDGCDETYKAYKGADAKTTSVSPISSPYTMGTYPANQTCQIKVWVEQGDSHATYANAHNATPIKVALTLGTE